MEHKLIDQLYDEGALNENEKKILTSHFRSKPFSLFWELRTLLYLGIVLLASGIGLLIYQNIDTIGHQTILAAVALASVACFSYSFRKSSGYAHHLVPSPTFAFDYILIAGCLLFVAFGSYLQYQYEVFGTRYGLATFIPAVFYLFLAYRFDNKSVLTMGVTSLAAWLGIAITPMDVFTGKNDFSDFNLIYSAIGLGMFLIVAALYLDKQEIKKHFTFTYLSFASNILFIATLSGLFISESYFLYFLLLAPLVTGFIWYARRNQSYYFLLTSSLAGYIGFTYVLFKTIDSLNVDLGELGFLYVILSCSGVIWFIYNFKKLLGK